MFGNIKKKLNDVFQDSLVLTENLSSGNQFKHNSSYLKAQANIEFPHELNPAAGCNILKKNEEIWNEIHERNEKNVKLALEVDSSCAKVKKNAEKMYLEIADLSSCLAEIPSINNKLENCLKIIEIIKKDAESLENKLKRLQETYDEIEFQEKQLEDKLKLSQHEQEKMKELAAQHVENLRRQEEQLQKIQKERQAVFQDAFEYDLELFKEKGMIPKIERVKENISKQVSLEDIVLDGPENKSELEEFLNDN